MTDTARLFRHGKGQAVRLPPAYEFDGQEVYIRKVGNAVLLLPKESPWEILTTVLNSFGRDFMTERRQPPTQPRERVFP